MFGFCQVFYTLGFIWHRFQLWASLAHSSTRTQKSLPLARPVKQKKVGLGLSYTGRGENVYFPASFKSFLEVGVSEIGGKNTGEFQKPPFFGHPWCMDDTSVRKHSLTNHQTVEKL